MPSIGLPAIGLPAIGLPAIRLPWIGLLALLGCAEGEAGDPCSGDYDCESASCTLGSCDSALAFLVADILHRPSASERPSPREVASESAPPAPSCDGLDEPSCRANDACRFQSVCLIAGECFTTWDTQVCAACLTGSCESPCALATSCVPR